VRGFRLAPSGGNESETADGNVGCGDQRRRVAARGLYARPASSRHRRPGVPLAIANEFARDRPDLVTLVRASGADRITVVDIDWTRHGGALSTFLSVRA
jgi:hypothetical protein